MSVLDEWSRQNDRLAEKLEVLEAVADVVLKLTQHDE